ncbi:MAG: prolipoprotein diacylglyceryl transferase [Proteobacteria bacterium]|nr:prolipoprotein diacylglyceryl transferase [Pseudomonadota bacterium]
MLFVLPFPVIDPVLVAIGPFAIRWYALAYIVSLLVGWRYARRLAERPPAAASVNEVDDFLLWATLGVILGGRLGYVLFYNTAFYLAEPLAVLQVWHGGMSYHGGMLGVIAAGALFCHKRQLSFLLFMDRIACVVPIGLFLGRLANFINGELFGRVSDVPWAMVFPRGGPEPRHPSQLYEAALEGVLLFVLLWALQRNERVREKAGFLSGVFLLGYGISRTLVELVRAPDAQLGVLMLGSTMGQLLSLPMIAFGIYLIVRARPVARI